MNETPVCVLPRVTGSAFRHKLLDLYCCGGGAGHGYEQAGFDVTGIDIEPQQKHKGKFIQADAIEYLKAHWQEYVDLIALTRIELQKTGLPYIIENVPGSPLINPIELCGAMFGMKTYRHRLFESNIKLIAPEHPKHISKNTKMGRKPINGDFIQYVGHFSGVKEVQEMTGLHWLGQYELAQSIPPQYTKYLGMQLMDALSLHYR